MKIIGPKDISRKSKYIESERVKSILERKKHYILDFFYLDVDFEDLLYYYNL